VLEADEEFHQQKEQTGIEKTRRKHHATILTEVLTTMASSGGQASAQVPSPPVVVETPAGSASAASAPIQRRRWNCTWTNLCSCLPEFIRDRYERQYFLLVVLTSPVWRMIMCLCILLLLFGSEIQGLWAPKQYDTTFDILYTVAFFLFICDILLRAMSVPGYIGCNCKLFYNRMVKFCCRGQRRSYHDEVPMHFGSFLFWCDVVSTLAILYDISYVTPQQNEIKVANIQLGPLGIPVRRMV
jgi:hypothetical protein